jgi:hypothetical protein
MKKTKRILDESFSFSPTIIYLTWMVMALSSPVVAAAAAVSSPARDWREQVKTKQVVQPETDTHSGWKFTPQPFPPIASVVAQQPDAVPLYGVYQWGGEYLEFRKEIQAVGWTSYRMGGFVHHEALVAAMEDGIELMPVLQIGQTLQDLKDTGKRHNYESDEAFISKYLEHVDAFCQTYGPGGTLFTSRPELAKHAVRHIEIWNEPNFQYMIKDEPDRAKVNAERDRLYAKLLKQTCEMVKAKHPGVKTVAFSAGGSAFDDVRFIKNVHGLDPALINAYDILSTHPYTDTPPHAERLKSWGSYSVTGAWAAIRGVLAKHGGENKPIWYTEVGWRALSQEVGATFKDNPDTLPKPAMVHAACVVKMYALASRLGVRRVHIMSVADADNTNSGFFTRSTKEWRPAAYAVQEMIRLMPQPRLLAVLSEENGGVYAYQYKSDWTRKESPEVVMAWREQNKGEVAVSLPAGRTVAKVVNMLGGEVPFQVQASRVAFAGGPLPCYVVLE